MGQFFSAPVKPEEPLKDTVVGASKFNEEAYDKALWALRHKRDAKEAAAMLKIVMDDPTSDAAVICKATELVKETSQRAEQARVATGHF